MSASDTGDLFERLRGSERLARAREEEGLVGYYRPIEQADGPEVVMDGQAKLMFGSSNYLGLAHDPRIRREAQRALDTYGTATNGSRVLNGTLRLHEELEREIAEWMGTESATMFTSGYTANLGALDALLTGEHKAICDAMCHASIFDGVRLSGAQLYPFRHGRVARLESVLEGTGRESPGARLVVVDGIYSMEGDVTDLAGVAEVCERHDVRLYVDEAHAVGVLGEHGTGTSEVFGVADKVDLRMGTMSKALASMGGFIAGPTEVTEYIRYHSRAMLFTASPVPAAAGAALAAVRFCRTAERTERAEEVLENARYLRRGLTELGFEVPAPSRTADGSEVMTPIVKVGIGDSDVTHALWKTLYSDEGIYVHAAVYPSVPQGAALLRLTTIHGHTREHLDRVLTAFERLGRMRQAAPSDSTQIEERPDDELAAALS
jgi:8-amino-7-oxononanoate synthase